MNSIKWIAVAIMVTALFWSMVASEKNQLESGNYKECLKAMQEAIPDPNDDSRSSFLQECQQR